MTNFDNLAVLKEMSASNSLSRHDLESKMDSLTYCSVHNISTRLNQSDMLEEAYVLPVELFLRRSNAYLRKLKRVDSNIICIHIG